MTPSYEMPKVGDVLAGKYRLEKVAGEGGMGIVYAAEHLVLKQRVAVKVLLPDVAANEAVVERFGREAQAAARIQSEHVARIMDAGSLSSGAPFLVMEYLEGCDLDELLKLQGTLAVAEVADYVLQALEALAHAHVAHLVHRDLKPANLFLACRPDGGNVIKILDFGISKSMKSTPEEKVLTGQAVLGSPVYMSPEQLRNSKQIDPRADIWSLGVVVYELLTGKPPFDGDGVGEIFAAILEKDAEPLHLRNPKVPPELSGIIAKCLKRNVDERWRNVSEFAHAIAPFGSGAYAPLVERTEQLLARANLITTTPFEAKLIADAIAQARAQAGATPAAVRTTQTSLAGMALPETLRRALDRLPEPLRRRSSARWAGVVAMVVIGVVGVWAVRDRPEKNAPLPQARAAMAAPVATAASVALPPAGDQPPSDAEPEGEGDVDAPLVLDLPNTAGPATGSAARSSRGKPSKPQRPKFLNSRE